MSDQTTITSGGCGEVRSGSATSVFDDSRQDVDCVPPTHGPRAWSLMGVKCC